MGDILRWLCILSAAKAVFSIIGNSEKSAVQRRKGITFKITQKKVLITNKKTQKKMLIKGKGDSENSAYQGAGNSEKSAYPNNIYRIIRDENNNIAK